VAAAQQKKTATMRAPAGRAGVVQGRVWKKKTSVKHQGTAKGLVTAAFDSGLQMP